MSELSGLFRPEVLDSDSKFAFGDIVLIYPISNYLMLSIALALLVLTVVFVSIGKYTRHESVSGVLEPNGGVIKVYAPQGGVLKTLNAHEGQAVHKGDMLMILESERVSAGGQLVEQNLDQQVSERLDTFRHENASSLKLQEVDVKNMQENVATQEKNQGSLTTQIETQMKRVNFAEQTVTRYEQLQKSGFIPEIQVQQKIDDLMDQQQRQQTLQTSLNSINTEIKRLRLELASASLRRQVVKAQFDRNISITETELSKQKNGHEWTVVSPCDGTVSLVTITNNQAASSSVPLVTIVPANSQLQANLYAPSRSLGFLKVGQLVKMKLDSFPYQKFGFVEGTVISISDSPVRPTETSLASHLSANGETGEPLFTIRVALKNQFIDAYGEQKKLRPGSQVDAEIQLETRRLYEWVLDPLYSIQHA